MCNKKWQRVHYMTIGLYLMPCIEKVKSQDCIGSIATGYRLGD
jgi:hypothetical protein